MEDSESQPDQAFQKVAKGIGVIALIIVLYYAALGIRSVNDRPGGRPMTATLSYAKQTATAVLLYAADYDDRLPHSFHNESSLYFILGPEQAHIATTTNPNGGSLMPNANLAGVLLSVIEAPRETVLIYETMTWPDRDRRVYSFVDGHAAFVTVDDYLIWGIAP